MEQYTHTIDQLIPELSKHKGNLVTFLKRNFIANQHYIEVLNIPKSNKKQHGGQNRIDFRLTEEAYNLLKMSYNFRNRNITMSSNIQMIKVVLPIETQTIGFIVNSYHGIAKMERQFHIGKYRVDLCFITYKLVIECDEFGHNDRNVIYEEIREKYIEKEGYRMIRYNPNEPNFELSHVLNKINQFIYTANQKAFTFTYEKQYKENVHIPCISIMDTSLNFVQLVESNPITRLGSEYNKRFVNKIKEIFTEPQQHLFLASLYCFLNYNMTDDYVINLDNIWQWLGFSQKAMAKRTLERYFSIDTDYKVLRPNSRDQPKEGRGGHNKETILLNIHTFQMLCIKADTKKAYEIHGYFMKMVEILQTMVLEENNELKIQLHKIKNEICTNKLPQYTPTIYVYNIDIDDKEKSYLKIEAVYDFIDKSAMLKQTDPRGVMVFHKEIDEGINLETFEDSVHDKLAPFRVNSEVFCMSAEEAITCILAEYNMYKIMKNTNTSERSEQIKQLHYFMENGHEPITKVPTHDEGTQTEFNEMIPATTPLLLDNQDMLQRFDAFIQDHCIVRPDVQVSAKDIVGQYRLHCQEAKKEITQGFTDYLKRRFVYGRLTEQTKDQVVLGFSGVVLKPIVYQKGPVPSDEETAVFEKCVFTPAGTMLFADIWEAYVDWKRVMKKPVDETQDPQKLKQYLKSSPYTLFDTVWSSGGSGQGFYGIKLKRDVKHHRTSSTGCAIVKKNMDGMVLCEYDTIAKAAAEESMCPAKMSRSVKNRVTFGTGDFLYYYEKKPRS